MNKKKRCRRNEPWSKFEVLPQHLPERTKKTIKTCLDVQLLGQDLNLGFPKYTEFDQPDCNMQSFSEV
jgi:hypothetical protein